MTVQIYYNDIVIGQEIPSVVKPISIPIMMRWCAAIEMWRRDHWDRDYARNQRGLPDAILSSGFKQAALYQMLQDWVGDGGWVWKMNHQDRGMVCPGDTLTGWGKVTRKYESNGLGYIELELGLKKPDGTVAVPASATVVLPLRNGSPLPYPFQP